MPQRITPSARPLDTRRARAKKNAGTIRTQQLHENKRPARKFEPTGIPFEPTESPFEPAYSISRNRNDAFPALHA